MINKNIVLKKPTVESVSWLAFFLYLLFSILANHTLFLHLAGLFFLLMSALYMLVNKSAYFSIYFVFAAMYIVYNVYLNYSGIAVDISVSRDMTLTLIINLVINFMIFNFLVINKNIEKALKFFIYATIIGILIISAMSVESLLSGRLASNLDIIILGQRLHYNANLLGFFTSTALLISAHFFIKKKSKKYFFYSLFLMIMTLLTGSRKAFGLSFLGILILFFISNPQKRFRMVIIGSIVSGGLLYLVLNVPMLYEIIGIRLEEAINLFQGEVSNDYSINTREHMTELGLINIKMRPLTGFGLDSYKIVNGVYSVYSHNNYIEILVSGGFVGLLLYYLPFIYSVVKLINIPDYDEGISKLIFVIVGLNIILDLWQVTYFLRQYSLLIILAFALFKIDKKVLNKTLFQSIDADFKS